MNKKTIISILSITSFFVGSAQAEFSSLGAGIEISNATENKVYFEGPDYLTNPDTRFGKPLPKKIEAGHGAKLKVVDLANGPTFAYVTQDRAFVYHFRAGPHGKTLTCDLEKKPIKSTLNVNGCQSIIFPGHGYKVVLY